MSQARNHRSDDHEWYDDQRRLPPSLGVWPLGGTYVHSSAGALNTGSAHGHTAAAGDGRAAPSSSGHRREAPGRQADRSGDRDPGRGNRRPGDRDPGRGNRRPGDAAAERDGRGPVGRSRLYAVKDTGLERHQEVERSFGGAGHIAVPRFTGDETAATPLYERPAAAPAETGPPREGRPALYQVGGRYRGDDWPTDPGFRRGDLGLDELRDDDVERDATALSGRAGRRGAQDRGDGATRDPGYGGGRHPEQDRDRDGGRGRAPAPRRPERAGRARLDPQPLTPGLIHDLAQRLKTVRSLYPRLVFLVVGYAAITSLAAAYAEKLPLPVTASLVVIPAAAVIFSMGMCHPDWGRRALVGWMAGIVATIIHDCLRLWLVKFGLWDGPIPGIGRLVFDDPHANFAWGYFWRICGNGGGMGMAYAMLPWRGWKTGVAYGTLICTGLLGLRFLFPEAQALFFPLTPITAIGGYAGHWVYGAVLGKITSWWLPPVELGQTHRRLTGRRLHPGHRPRDRRRADAHRAGPRHGSAGQSGTARRGA